MEGIGSLSTLAVRHGSDKWGAHAYTPHYEAHFESFRTREFNLFEIGVGGYDDPRAGGSSLRMWLEYFPNARIVALDYYDKSSHARDRVRIYQGDQSDAGLLRRIHEESGPFDIIVDDGSHENEHVIKSFSVLFPLLSNGGVYVVEDLQTSYWPRLGGSLQSSTLQRRL